jgi:hypothetical protein
MSADTAVDHPGTAAVLPALLAGQLYYPLVSACNALQCSTSQSGAATAALALTSRPVFQKLVRRSLTEILVAWHAPADVGDGSGYLPGKQQELGFRLEILNQETSAALTAVRAAQRLL